MTIGSQEEMAKFLVDLDSTLEAAKFTVENSAVITLQSSGFHIPQARTMYLLTYTGEADETSALLALKGQLVAAKEVGFEVVTANSLDLSVKSGKLSVTQKNQILGTEKTDEKDSELAMEAKN